MSRLDRDLLGYAIAAAIVSASFWALWVVTDSTGALTLALFIHLTAAGLTAVLVDPHRRALAVALGIVVPVLGPFAAALATIIAGRGGADLLHDPHAIPARLDGAEIARRLTCSMPVCEALSSSDTAARRQALSKLRSRGAAEDIAILRWARSQRTGDAAVEVALAFEEISSRFEQQATAARAAALASPSYASYSAAFLILTAGISNGVVDGQLVARLAAESARHHEAAVALDPIRGRELLVARGRLELALHRPGAALDLLSDPELDLSENPELAALHREAAYAARRFDLVPGMSRGRA
jgi:hypothetical protein